VPADFEAPKSWGVHIPGSQVVAASASAASATNSSGVAHIAGLSGQCGFTCDWLDFGVKYDLKSGGSNIGDVRACLRGLPAMARGRVPVVWVLPLCAVCMH